MKVRKIRKTAQGLALSALLSFSSASYAQLSGVSFIDVYSAIPTFLQISEVVATKTGTGTNVALAGNGGVASGIGGLYFGNGGGVAFANDGIFPSAYPQIYASAGNATDHLRISLASSSILDSVTIYGRTDTDSERDVYNVKFFNSNNELLFESLGANANNRSHSVTISMPTVTAVPEPETYAMMLAGLGLLGYAARRRKQKAAG